MDTNTIILIAQLLLKYGPEVAQQISNALNKPDEVTKEDWNKMFDNARKYAEELLKES